MLFVLDVSDRPDFFDVGGADDEAATFVRKLAFGLRDDLIQSSLRDRNGVHD